MTRHWHLRFFAMIQVQGATKRCHFFVGCHRCHKCHKCHMPIFGGVCSHTATIYTTIVQHYFFECILDGLWMALGAAVILKVGYLLACAASSRRPKAKVRRCAFLLSRFLGRPWIQNGSPNGIKSEPENQPNNNEMLDVGGWILVARLPGWTRCLLDPFWDHVSY